MSPEEMNAVVTALEDASALAAARQDDAALQAYRRSVQALLTGLRNKIEGEPLRLLLMAFRGLAISAFVTGRVNEGRLALGTALAHADLGLKHWVDAPPLLAERAILLQLAEKTGGVQACPVLIHGDDNQAWTWPFDD